jgi:hypothetical protein
VLVKHRRGDYCQRITLAAITRAERALVSTIAIWLDGAERADR